MACAVESEYACIGVDLDAVISESVGDEVCVFLVGVCVEDSGGDVDEQDFFALSLAGFGHFDADVSGADDGDASDFSFGELSDGGFAVTIGFDGEDVTELASGNIGHSGRRARGKDEFVVIIDEGDAVFIDTFELAVMEVDRFDFGFCKNFGAGTFKILGGGIKETFATGELAADPQMHTARKEADFSLFVVDMNVGAAEIEERFGGSASGMIESNNDNFHKIYPF